MKIVDEKKALAEISNLRKHKKNFASFEASEKDIAALKAQITEHRKSMDNPEAKAFSDRYNAITKKLDEMKAQSDEAFKGINALRDERTKLQADQQMKYQAMRQIKDNFYKAKSAYRDWDQEQYRARQEKQKAEREAYLKEKRMKIASEKLEEASSPAFLDEIMTAEGLIRHFDPNAPVEAKVLRAPSGMEASAQRKVDEGAFKGMKVVKKEDKEEAYFMGGGGKKKKGKKGPSTDATAAPIEGKFNLSIGVIEQLGKVGVDTPMNQSEIPAVVEKLKAKVELWKKDQAEQTKKVCLTLACTML
jgi:chromosome segregation ATPase